MGASQIISENKKTILIELVNALDDKLSEFIHLIEQDQNIPDDSAKFLDNESSKLFEQVRLLHDEIYFT